ncbi:PAS domain S-box protein [Geobacter sp. FeAm09]|uniref:PAS domain S-box protein n=1 Tax=Geobacter sp. FeAm09 TaxID=2597769 RepID=UPI0011EFA702|nr:PAS domain S-box protein [Geobacter sp. FeAm09]QEM69991.1 PAS domain S-box protein [Geobacter sp. FeAm09]
MLGALLSFKVAKISAENRLSDAKSQAISDLATVRARLEAVANSVFSATSGLVNVVGYQGNISPELFTALASQAIKSHPHIRTIALAPDNRVAMIYPVTGNERMLGLHYSTIAEQYGAVEEAMQTRVPILSGPHKLIQGGEGFILRSPVFTGKGAFRSRYWGVVSIVASVKDLMEAGGITSSANLEIGLRQGKSASGGGGSPIWGDDSVFSRQPVSMTVAIPGGAWQIAAIRKGGWPTVTVFASPLFYVGLLNSILLAGFAWVAASRHHRVQGENRKLLEEVEERTRMEKELRLSQQKYLNIFNMMPDMVGITRLADGTLMEVNNGFEVWTGWQACEAIGRTSLELGLWDEETRSRAISIVKETGRLENYEFLLGTKSGEKRNALMYLTTIKAGGEDCLYFMAHDITALKQAQTILENERSRLRILIQTIPALVWMKDADGIYLICNSRFERFFGACEPDIIGKTDYDFVNTKQADIFRENDRKAIAAGKPTINEEWITFADDGHRELLETTKTPVRDAEGNLIGVLGIARDITEYRRTEEELKTERLRFRNLVDSVDSIVWEADAETLSFVYVSQQAVRLLGYPVEEWYRQGFWVDHLHPEDREWAPAFCMKKIAQGQDHDFEFRFIACDGRVIWLHDIVTVVTEAGRPRWLRGIMVDTTEAKREEAAKLKLEAQLRQAQKMEAIGRLAGGVAHDFNNKLAVILGYAEMANRAGSGAERYRDYLGRIIKAAGQSREITRQLLAFSRQEVVSPRVIDLNDVVADSQKGLCRFIGEDIRLEARLAERLWPVNIDPTQFDQIIMNLVVNARDAMADGGSLTIETRNVSIGMASAAEHPDVPPGDYVQMTVSDTGCGMDQETLQHIFEPFFTTKEAAKGTGLGLATVYGIVSQNQGVVNVCSEPGTGTTFVIYFPRCDDLASAPEPAEPALQLDHPATILLVEDDDSVREIAAEILQEIGYTILIAATARDAVEICTDSRRRIDLLLTDVIMPEMNGRELSHRIAALKPDIRVLFMSGYTAEVIDQKGILAEGLQFVQKPFDRAVLHRKIQSILHDSATSG